MLKHHDIAEIDWSDRRADTPAEATAKMRWWAMRHGLRSAVCNVTIRERAMISIADKRAIYADAADICTTPTTHADQRDLIGDWCAQHHYTVITTRQLSDTIGCTPGVARRYVRDHPQHFKRLNQYTYEVRDFQADRDHGKSIA